MAPGQGVRTPDEATVFRVPAGSVIAPQNYVSGYEGLYPWRTTTNTIEGMMDGEWTNPPFTFVLPDKSAYASITEGALVNYSGMVFQADAAQALHARLGHAEPAASGSARATAGYERLSHPAAINGPHRHALENRDDRRQLERPGQLRHRAQRGGRLPIPSSSPRAFRRIGSSRPGGLELPRRHGSHG